MASIGSWRAPGTWAASRASSFRRASWWTGSADSSPTVYELPADVAARGSRGVLEYINQRTAPRGPVDVYLSDRHMAFESITGSATPTSIRLHRNDFDVIQRSGSSWLHDLDPPNPVLRALFHTFVASPRRIRSAVTKARHRAVT
ncbi:hypothetical protein [Mycolicibacterium pallens]|uniref:Uncharacterized protein n=1 Tax=Mycolicibacterium pallens TaxID=370524 RepID=A0ABX8VKK2_9MYCO|nr:hypothetical protein [Mycolicibacterium pallens]QYL18324.1 hypothetical protein K0O64_07325 [Mycolicibacterium pallens]